MKDLVRLGVEVYLDEVELAQLKSTNGELESNESNLAL